MSKTQTEDGVWVPYEEVTKYLDTLSKSLMNISKNIEDTMIKMDEFIEAKESDTDG
jgi:hypothetical protein